jgi:UDP-N-acetylglucosamine--N-acetylmuramyl-(pentapeptide) pyrophosphoryl-undecaprenol N-acetylglucosamine transferase
MATAEALNDYRRNGYALELYYFGPTPYDAELLRAHDITFVHCPSGKWRKYFSPLNFLDLFKLAAGFFVAFAKLYLIYPDVIFSKGSYTSVPVTFAASLLRIPVVIHESDTRPGSANKMAARFARYIAISFEDVAPYFPKEKTALTGIPLRRSLTARVDSPLAALGLSAERPLLFVTGGSLGAQRLNDLILQSLDELLPRFTILHQTGKEQEDAVQKTAASLISDIDLLEHYFVKGSLTAEEMNLALEGASIIVSRAGTGTIYEIASKGKPSILIPIPEEVSHDQKTNAYAYARSGAATVLEEGNLTDGLLAAEINRIMDDTAVYQEMSAAARVFAPADAAATIAKTLIGIAEEHG